MSDELNPEFLFRETRGSILAMILAGEIDPIQLARQEMAQRGLDASGKWVGFEKAAEIHGVKP